MSSTRSSWRGILYPAMCCRQWSWSSSRVMSHRHPLTKDLIGHSDHDGVVDAGVGLDRRLDLLGKDLLPARVDRTGSPPVNGDAPIGLHRGQVPRYRPANAIRIHGKRRSGLGLILEVANRDMSPPGQATDAALARLQGQ